MIVKVCSGDFDGEYEIFETNASKCELLEAFRAQVKTNSPAIDALEEKGYSYNVLQTQHDDQAEIISDFEIDLSLLMDDL